jgi:hypothetical protein
MFCWTVPSRLPAPTNKSRGHSLQPPAQLRIRGSSQPAGASVLVVVGLILLFIMLIIMLAFMVILLMIWLPSILAWHFFRAWLLWVCPEIVPCHRSGEGDRARWSASTREAREGLGAGHLTWRRRSRCLVATRQQLGSLPRLLKNIYCTSCQQSNRCQGNERLNHHKDFGPC